ncbi:MAG: MATE family efflux transporter [Oscillospiraceae bacterium]|nr:MATE family efflux transporter [Oscillospiraceae bacterium]
MDISFRTFGKYTCSNVAGMLGISIYILADTFFVSRALGANGLAALNIAVPVYSLIHGCGLLVGMGGATRFSIMKGKKNAQGGSRMFSAALLLALCLGALFLILGVTCAGPITTLIGANDAVFHNTKTYVQVILLFGPMFILNNLLLCFVRNDGAPQRSMLAMLIGSLSNIVLDYIFIFPYDMGIFGAALATGIAPCISLLILSPFFAAKRNSFHVAKGKPSPRHMTKLAASGIPSLTTELSSGIVVLIFNAITLRLEGTTGVAAYGIIANISLAVVAVYTGIAQGIQPLMGQGYGAGKRSDVQALLRYALITATVLSVLVYLLMFFGAPEIVGAFNKEQNAHLRDLALPGMRIYFTACLFVGFNIILSTYFTSTERTLSAHVVSMLRGFFVIIPMALLLSSVLAMTGVFLAFPVTELLVAVVTLLLYCVGRTRHAQLPG